MLYPARSKKITVDQNKVLKIDCFVFWGATRYCHVQLFCAKNFLAFEMTAIRSTISLTFSVSKTIPL